MKMYLYMFTSILLDNIPQETTAMQNNFFIVFKQTGNAGNQLYLNQMKNEDEETCNWLGMSSTGHNSLPDEAGEA